MIAVEGLGARVGRFALHDVSFTVPAGGYGVVIGPAGAGKTTLLEAIAGTVASTSGTVRLAGPGGAPRDVSALPPEARDVGFVYQHAYLFPHLDTWGNVRYGAPDDDAARDAAGRTGADRLLGRDPRTLSGGERQLVALARALARRPPVLLLDEPFGALDPRRRDLVRRAVRDAHREWGATVLQVTHDFAEAGLLGDVAVMLDAGRVVQQGSPDSLFRRPVSPDVAAFLGAENLIEGTARSLPAAVDAAAAPDDDAAAAPLRRYDFEARGLRLRGTGRVADGRCHAVVRGEDVVLTREAPASPRGNVLRGRLREIAPAGALSRVTVDVADAALVAALPARSARELGLTPGSEVWAHVDAEAVHLC